MLRLVSLLALVGLLAGAPTPVLSVNPTDVTLTGTENILLPDVTVQVSNVGTGALKWSVSAPTATWVRVSPTKGTNTGVLTLRFPVPLAAGSYSAAFTVSAKNQFKTVTVALTMTTAAPPLPPPTPPPTETTYGPTSTITCPVGATNIAPGTNNIQAVVDANPTGTTFCLQAGTFHLTSAVTPKSGDKFIGQYGAILDGTGWSTSDSTQAAFRAHNQDIDDVTIQNLVIQHMPQKGIHAFYWQSDRWTINHNEIAYNATGLNAPHASTVSANYIHHNITATPDNADPALRGGGYAAYRAIGTTFDGNEMAFNGSEQKVTQTQHITFRNNYVHDNYHDGIWYDGDNTDGLIDNNQVENNGRNGVFYEISGTATIQNNTITGNADTGIFISTSKNVTIAGNTLTNNFRGIQYFLNCDVLGTGTIGHDLMNDVSHDNRITIPSTSGAFGNGFTYASTTCTSTEYAPYYNLQKGLTFQSNSYTAPTLTGNWFIWGFGHLVNWTSWRALPQDTNGSIAVP